MKRVRLLTGYIRETLQVHWLLIHALVAPWGTLIITGILVNLDRISPEIWVFWRYWGDIGAMSSTVSYGAAVYGCAVSATEVIVRMAFYAIAKILEEQDRRREERQRREKERERQLNEARREGLEAGIQEGLQTGLERGMDLVLNNPEMEHHPELRERVRKEAEAALKENGR